MFSMLLAAVVLSQPQVNDRPLEFVEPPAWEVLGGLTGGVRPGSGDGSGGFFLGVNRSVTRWLRPEILVGEALSGGGGPLQMLTSFRIGTRIVWPRASVLRPFLWVALAHNHEVSTNDVKDNPVPAVLGLSEHGVVHRTGIDTGIGLSVELPRKGSGRVAGRFSVRATMTSLLGAGPPRSFDLLATVGVCF